jgi:hypothetical protein
MRSTRARHAKSQLAALVAAGLLERSRRHGLEAWHLTAAGLRRLRRAEREGRVPALPESPQHRSWRHARATASHEIERARRELRAHLDQALVLLDAEQSSSDAWFEVGDRLGRSPWLVGSMTHCLHEWNEPDDEHPDHDEHTAPGDEQLEPDERIRVRARRRGRRNTGLWRR